VVGVAGGIDLAIDGGERNAEQRRIDLAELGDIVGDLAAGCLPDALMQLGQEIVHRRKSGASSDSNTAFDASVPRTISSTSCQSVARGASARVSIAGYSGS